MDLIIPKSTFHLIIREITEKLNERPNQVRYQVAALMALQEATEHFMSALFENAYSYTCDEERVTLLPKDFLLAMSVKRQL